MPANSQTALETPGGRIRFLRRSKDMTQESLARAVFTTQPTIARWEKDEFLPSRQSQRLLADALGVSPAFLFPEWGQ
jgi:transcriptional regulator with XRE-family HTH domain